MEAKEVEFTIVRFKKSGKYYDEEKHKWTVPVVNPGLPTEVVYTDAIKFNLVGNPHFADFDCVVTSDKSVPILYHG